MSFNIRELNVRIVLYMHNLNPLQNQGDCVYVNYLLKTIILLQISLFEQYRCVLTVYVMQYTLRHSIRYDHVSSLFLYRAYIKFTFKHITYQADH